MNFIVRERNGHILQFSNWIMHASLLLVQFHLKYPQRLLSCINRMKMFGHVTKIAHSLLWIRIANYLLPPPIKILITHWLLFARKVIKFYCFYVVRWRVETAVSHSSIYSPCTYANKPLFSSVVVFWIFFSIFSVWAIFSVRHWYICYFAVLLRQYLLRPTDFV